MILLRRVHYVPSNTLIRSEATDVYYGVGTSAGWRRFTRNLYTDLLKGLTSHSKRYRNILKVRKPL